MAESRLLWRLANQSTLKVLRGEFRGQYHIILGRTDPITEFFAELPQVVDRKGLWVQLWTEPVQSSSGEEEIPPWRLTVRRMSAESARPLEWYISSQQPGATHPLWRPGTGPIDTTEPDSDYVLLLRTAGDRFLAGWLRGDQLANAPDRLRAEIEASKTGTSTLGDDEVAAILTLLGQFEGLESMQAPDEELVAANELESAVEEAPTALEGQPVMAQHVRRERSRSLRRRRIDAAGERPTCEACGFDFEQVYGDRGRGFVECHHLLPISELDPATPTRLEDLALLCANCHRMVHVSRPWLDLEQLKQLLEQHRCPG